MTFKFSGYLGSTEIVRREICCGTRPLWGSGEKSPATIAGGHKDIISLGAWSLPWRVPYGSENGPDVSQCSETSPAIKMDTRMAQKSKRGKQFIWAAMRSPGSFLRTKQSTEGITPAKCQSTQPLAFVCLHQGSLLCNAPQPSQE